MPSPSIFPKLPLKSFLYCAPRLAFHLLLNLAMQTHKHAANCIHVSCYLDLLERMKMENQM